MSRSLLRYFTVHLSAVTLHKVIGSLAIAIILPFIYSCSAENDKQEPAGCTGCHEVELDLNHRFACVSCHLGNDEESTVEIAHKELISNPAHPANAEKRCGACHTRQLELVKTSNHYTLSNHINKVRRVFGAHSDVTDASAIFSSPSPGSVLELVDDLLKRRCLRCHVYYQGDDFAKVRHGSGCAACHLSFYDGHMVSHQFLAHPKDANCLSCHYGNHVGFDYYGRFEHDYNEEYRTPYTTTNDSFRPYGVEYHQLEADIHQTAGMVCIDCHYQKQVMGPGDSNSSCLNCHEQDLIVRQNLAAIKVQNTGYQYTSPSTGKRFNLPVMKHPAHEEFNKKVSCQACHARWSFYDESTHLIRIDHDDFDEFYKLSLDGSYEVNQIITSNLDIDGEWLEPSMTDKFTGDSQLGIWFKGYSQRRWDRIPLALSQNGIVEVTRPALSLFVSWIDNDETVHYDTIFPSRGNEVFLPYTPHTTGPAGLFYEERLRNFFGQDSLPLMSNELPTD